MQISGIARSTFYYYLKNPSKDKYECEKQEITNIFNVNKGRYGYRRVLMVMRNNGYYINHKTVQKLMRGLGLKGKQRKNGQYHSYKGTVGKVADNILARDFHVIDRASDEEIGTVSKKWNGLVKEMFTNADKYAINISESLSNASYRIAIIATAIAIDILFREGRQ